MNADYKGFLAAHSIAMLEPIFEAVVTTNSHVQSQWNRTQIHTLFLLHNRDALTLTEIAQHHRISKQHVSNCIPAMEKAGLVVRSQRGDNKQKIYISITEKGIGEVQKVLYLTSKQISEFLTDMTDEDKEQITSCCNRLRDLLLHVLAMNGLR